MLEFGVEEIDIDGAFEMTLFEFLRKTKIDEYNAGLGIAFDESVLIQLFDVVINDCRIRHFDPFVFAGNKVKSDQYGDGEES
jgi:hypothetical protein